MGNQNLLSDLGEVENMDEFLAKSLKRHAQAQQAEHEQSAEAERQAEADRAGRKYLEQAQREHFMGSLGVLLQMSRWHSDITEERAAVKRAAEDEANARDYYRDRGMAQPDGGYVGYTAERSPVLRGIDTLRARLRGMGGR